MYLISGKNIWLFPSFKNKGHISDRTVNYRSKHILHNNGIQVANRKKYERGSYLHCMRHVFALNLLQRLNGEEGTLLMLSPSCQFILDMKTLMKRPNTLNSAMSCFRSPLIPWAELWLICYRKWTMKKVSFMDYLECYFNIYLPTVRGLSQSTIPSYKATFRILGATNEYRWITFPCQEFHAQ